MLSTLPPVPPRGAVCLLRAGSWRRSCWTMKSSSRSKWVRLQQEPTSADRRSRRRNPSVFRRSGRAMRRRLSFPRRTRPEPAGRYRGQSAAVRVPPPRDSIGFVPRSAPRPDVRLTGTCVAPRRDLGLTFSEPEQHDDVAADTQPPRRRTFTPAPRMEPRSLRTSPAIICSGPRRARHSGAIGRASSQWPV